ncbi:MAG: amidase family protein [Pseudomonadota bacterium]
MPTPPDSSLLHELSITAAAAAIRTGSLSASDYAAALLKRAGALAGLRAFITLDEGAVLEAARQADLDRKAGKPMGPLHGVPIAIKDSFNTRDMPTSMGTRLLASHQPLEDASVVQSLRAAGAVLFGKNNLVEMSYGLTGLNAHYGQVRNPYDPARVTGGSSSGAGACVAARIVPAALGGDTVGSIRVPSSLCGVVGFRPSTGRWPGRGIAPISHTLDTPGPMARTVEDCALLDAVATGRAWSARPFGGSLAGLRLGFAPRQHLDLCDSEVEACFRGTLDRLRDAGAEIVEIDLGEDFMPLALQANWPIFFGETMPHLAGYLAEQKIATSFEEIYDALGDNVKVFWRESVVKGAPGAIPAQALHTALTIQRPELQRRYADAYRSHRIDALLFPATPTVAPLIDEQVPFVIAGQAVDRVMLAKNAWPSSCAGLPGISLPIGLSSTGLPIGMEIDGPQGSDVSTLDVAARVSAAIGQIPGPRMACSLN